MTQHTSSSTPRVGFLGPGLMGAPMVSHIAAAGFPTAVWARRPEAAIALTGENLSPAATPREAAQMSPNGIFNTHYCGHS